MPEFNLRDPKVEAIFPSRGGARLHDRCEKSGDYFGSLRVIEQEFEAC